MMKKSIVWMLVLLMLVCLVSACGGGSNTDDVEKTEESGSSETAEEADSDVTEITLFNNKVEIDEALQQYAETYEELTGVKVNITTYGGGGAIDSFDMLKTMAQSGELPDIFVVAGPTHYEQFKEYILDLSNEEWVQYTDQSYYGESGEVVGFPVAIEGYALGYNARILEEAGVDPATLTNFEAIKTAFEDIDAQKEELGLDCVISMAASPELGWVTGEQNFNVYLSGGLARDDSSVIDATLAGEVDEERLRQYADYVELLFQYANRDNLTVITYDAQLNDFMLEKTAFIHQGNWIDPALKEAGIDFDMGYVPQAFTTTDTNGIFVSAPTWYVVNNQSPAVETAKKFLNDLALTPEGQDFMVNLAGMVPAFTNVELSPEGKLSNDVMRWNSEAETYAWNQYKLPGGFAQNTLAPIYEQFAAGSIDKETFIQSIADAIKNIG